MQFSKPMIEIVYQIRRFVPAELKPAIKLANDDLFEELRLYFHAGANAVTKALIKELFTLAGDDWAARLQQEQAPMPAQKVKVYRGQTIFEEKKPQPEKSKEEIRRRVYRGQVIYG